MTTNNAWNSSFPVSVSQGGTGTKLSTGTVLSYTTYSIDATTMGSIALFTTENNAYFTPLLISFEPTIISALVSVPSISIGTNSASHNNILPASALTGLTTIRTGLNFRLNAAIPAIPTGTQIFANVSVAAVATTYTIQITVVGFYS